MGSDTDRLPQLDEDSTQLVETIVLEESDVMGTREMRILVDAGAEAAPAEDDVEGDT